MKSFIKRAKHLANDKRSNKNLRDVTRVLDRTIIFTRLVQKNLDRKLKKYPQRDDRVFKLYKMPEEAQIRELLKNISRM